MINLKNEFGLKLAFEILWSLAVILICWVVVYPIFHKSPEYPFLWSNVAFIFIFLSFTRYIFFLRHSFFSESYIFKLILMGISIPLVIVLNYYFNGFRNFIDEQGLQSLFEDFSAVESDNLTSYIKNETVFFGVGSIIVSAIVFVRMLISIWAQYNNKKLF